MKAEDIMSKPVRCINPGMNLVEAAEMMRQLDVGALPICEGDRLTGMITDRDIVVRAVARGWNPARSSVRESMSPGIHYAFSDQELPAVAAIMEEHRVRRLPILDRQKRLVGMITTADIAREGDAALTKEIMQEVCSCAGSQKAR